MAGGFDLMRFQKCSNTLIPEIRRNRKWIVFWVFACFVFFFGLGIYPSIHSESRWFEVVREMLMTGDWLHPRINGQPYFDKPLVSYWFAAVVSKLAGGHVTELSVRLPSALFALTGLACIISVARKFYSERTAYLTGWLLLSTYSFIEWGRLAEADMEQTVFIVMAVTVYLHHRDKASFTAYFAFWGCCAVGAQTKGLPALVIPPALAVIDCIVRKSFRRHLNWKFFLAMFLGGLCLYSAPFVLEAMTSRNYSASGIVLVFRENLVRVFNPWDHKDDPFYIYFAYLPVLLIPWTPFFVFAVVDYVRGLVRRKQGSRDTLWLFASIAFIFVLFSASRSRRSYYILPIVPWCVLFTAAWFSEPAENWSFLRIITDRFARLVDILTPVAAAILILLPVAGIVVFRSGWLSMMDRDDLKSILLTLLPLAFFIGIAWLVFWRSSRKRLLREGAEGDFAPSSDPLNRAVPFVTLVMFAVFALVIAEFRSTATFEPTAPFLRSFSGDVLKPILDRNPDFMKRTAFFGDFGGSELTYYLDLQEPIPQFWMTKRDDASRKFTDDTTVVYGLDEFGAFLNDVRERGGAIITRGDCVEALRRRASEAGKLQALARQAYDAMMTDERKFAPLLSLLNLKRGDCLEALRKIASAAGESQARARYVYDALTDELAFVPVLSSMDLFKELELKRLRAKSEGRDDPKLKEKIVKKEGKRVIVFYHIPASAPHEETADGATEPVPRADSASSGTEGTPQP